MRHERFHFMLRKQRGVLGEYVLRLNAFHSYGQQTTVCIVRLSVCPSVSPIILHLPGCRLLFKQVFTSTDCIVVS